MPGGGAHIALFEGENPILYTSSDPIVLFLVQITVVIALSNLLHMGLSYLRQPKVVSEMLAGVILGPSVLGNIPGYTSLLFPTDSIPSFTTAATFGLIFLMFLVGLEIDLAQVSRHWRPALAVGAGGIIVPFGTGAGVAVALYRQFEPEPANMGLRFYVFVIFVGLAMSITAFPVLCRIMMELKILKTPVGIIVLSAGVANDVIGWALLALAVALGQSGSRLVALWVIISGIAWVVFMIYAVKPAITYVIQRSGGAEKEPTDLVILVILTILMISSWYTSIIGLHPIFGSFLTGSILPKQGVLVHVIASRLRTIIDLVFLPAFFALSGINTNIGSLSDSTDWCYAILVIATALTGKIIGAMLCARACSISWRESLTIGILMSCKGIVELIALNIGLQADIISEKTFSLFVVMALVVTASTQPLAAWIYPQNKCQDMS